MKVKLTPFIVCVIGLVILSVVKFHLLDFWTLDGGGSLIGVIALGSILAALIGFFLDRYFISNYSIKKVWIIEITILVIIALGYSYYTRRVECTVSDNVSFFVIVYNVETAPKLKYSFPFDKQLNIKSDTIILTSTPYEFGGSPNIHRKTYDLLSSENKYLNVGDKKYHYQLITFELLTESKLNLTQQQKDSIITEVKHKIEKK